MKRQYESLKKVFFFLFNEDQYSGIALLLDRDEKKKSVVIIHTKALNLCSAVN